MKNLFLVVNNDIPYCKYGSDLMCVAVVSDCNKSFWMEFGDYEHGIPPIDLRVSGVSSLMEWMTARFGEARAVWMVEPRNLDLITSLWGSTGKMDCELIHRNDIHDLNSIATRNGRDFSSIPQFYTSIERAFAVRKFFFELKENLHHINNAV